MPLILENDSLSAEVLENVFEDTFGAMVMVEIRMKMTACCVVRRQAYITITTSTVELQKFIRTIVQNGQNTLVIQGKTYTVTQEPDMDYYAMTGVVSI